MNRRDRVILTLVDPAHQRLLCGPLILVCLVGTGLVIDTAIDSAAGDFLSEMVEAAGEAATTCIRWMLGWWVDTDTVSVSDCVGGEKGSAYVKDTCGDISELDDSSAIVKMQSATGWLVSAMTVGAIIFASIRMALERSGKAAAQLVRGLVTMIIMIGLGLGITQLAITLGDNYSSWILDKAAGDKDVHEAFGEIVVTAIATKSSAMLLLALLLLAVFAGLAQMMMMFARMAGLILIAGMLPVAAASGLTETGRQTRDKYITWLIAFVIYKPAAATVWAAALWVVGDEALEGLDGLMVSVAMFLMALFALPAMMRLIAPAVATLSSGGGGGGGAAAGGALASGAMQLANAAGSGKGSGGGGGGSQPKPEGAGQSSEGKKNLPATTTTKPKGAQSNGPSKGGGGGTPPAGGGGTPPSGGGGGGGTPPGGGAAPKGAVGGQAAGGKAAAGGHPAVAATIMVVQKGVEVTKKAAEKGADGTTGED